MKRNTSSETSASRVAPAGALHTSSAASSARGACSAKRHCGQLSVGSPKSHADIDMDIGRPAVLDLQKSQQLTWEHAGSARGWRGRRNWTGKPLEEMRPKQAP